MQTRTGGSSQQEQDDVVRSWKDGARAGLRVENQASGSHFTGPEFQPWKVRRDIIYPQIEALGTKTTSYLHEHDFGFFF